MRACVLVCLRETERESENSAASAGGVDQTNSQKCSACMFLPCFVIAMFYGLDGRPPLSLPPMVKEGEDPFVDMRPLTRDISIGRCKEGGWCTDEATHESSKCFRWILLLQTVSAEIATRLRKLVVCRTGTTRKVKCVRIEGGVGLCFVELRYIADILPVTRELEGLTEMIAEPWKDTHTAGVQWINLQSTRSYGGYHCILQLGRSFETTNSSSNLVPNITFR